ncbi:MAG: hypothetical protein PVG74_13505 [Desulfobacterales bacterium]|jgi:hypothetical protein
MILSESSDFLSRLADSAGQYPDVLVIVLLFVLLVVGAAVYILVSLRRTDRELIAAERELDEFAQNLDLQASEDIFQPIHGRSVDVDPSPGQSPDLSQPSGIPNESDAGSNDQTGIGTVLLGKMKGFLSIKPAKPDNSLKGEAFTSSLINNSDLKSEVLGLISKTDKSISLQHLVKHLSGNYFDGNYHPVLNQLEQLETEGKIEGQVINGKVFYKKKQKTERKYTLRKGRNFRKYIG